jgi:hypothetical protein
VEARKEEGPSFLADRPLSRHVDEFAFLLQKRARVFLEPVDDGLLQEFNATPCGVDQAGELGFGLDLIAFELGESLV